MLFSLDSGLVFDPVDLGEEVTPQSVHSALEGGSWSRALGLALRLRDVQLLQRVIMAVPPAEVSC